MANAEGMVGADIDHENFTATRLRVLAICRGGLLAKSRRGRVLSSVVAE